MGSLLCKGGISAARNVKEGVTFVNNTKGVIQLRERDREVYGALRYTLNPNEQEIVCYPRDHGTYYSMAVLVQGEDGRVTPTHLAVDSDELGAYNKIIVTKQEGGRYVLTKSDSEVPEPSA